MPPFCDGSDEIFTDEEREEIEAAEEAREEAALTAMLASWPHWAADLYLEIDSWVTTLPGWRGYLEWMASRRGSEARVSWKTLDGPIWARQVLAETAEDGTPIGAWPLVGASS